MASADCCTSCVQSSDGVRLRYEAETRTLNSQRWTDIVRINRSTRSNFDDRVDGWDVLGTQTTTPDTLEVSSFAHAVRQSYLF